MPIRRRGDGEIVNEETQPIGRDDDGPTKPVTDGDSRYQPTRRIDQSGGSLFDDDSDRSAPPGESLFGGDRNRGLESPTEPMRGRKAPGASTTEASDGRTRVYRGGRGRGVAEAGDDPMADPPVGWLVVIGGPGKGRVLTLGSGMNAIGRGAESRVRLDFGDDNVSRLNHARVIYEPRQRRWLLNHGDGTNLTYLNGDVVVGVAEIQSGAEIQLGDTTLRFQAFCSEEFDWQDVDD